MYLSDLNVELGDVKVSVYVNACRFIGKNVDFEDELRAEGQLKAHFEIPCSGSEGKWGKARLVACKIRAHGLLYVRDDTHNKNVEVFERCLMGMSTAEPGCTYPYQFRNRFDRLHGGRGY